MRTSGQLEKHILSEKKNPTIRMVAGLLVWWDSLTRRLVSGIGLLELPLSFPVEKFDHTYRQKNYTFFIDAFTLQLPCEILQPRKHNPPR